MHPSGSPCLADEWTLCLFATFLAASVQHFSIKVYLSAVRSLHIEEGFPDPLLNCLRLQRVVRGIKRSQGSSSYSHLPIIDGIMMVIFKFLDLSMPDHCMFWAAFTLGYFGFLRSAEFTVPNIASFSASLHLGVHDVAVDSDSNPSCLHTRTKASKTDPFRKGYFIHIGKGQFPLCALQALMSYYQFAWPLQLGHVVFTNCSWVRDHSLGLRCLQLVHTSDHADVAACFSLFHRLVWMVSTLLDPADVCSFAEHVWLADAVNVSRYQIAWPLQLGHAVFNACSWVTLYWHLGMLLAAGCWFAPQPLQDATDVCGCLLSVRNTHTGLVLCRHLGEFFSISVAFAGQGNGAWVSLGWVCRSHVHPVRGPLPSTLQGKGFEWLPLSGLPWIPARSARITCGST